MKKYKIKITYRECSIDTEVLLSFGSYEAAEDYYNNFDLDGFPAGTTIKRLYI